MTSHLVAPNDHFALMMNAIAAASTLVGVGLVYAVALFQRKER